MRVVVFVRAHGSSGSGFRSLIISLPIRAKAEAVLEVKLFVVAGICVIHSHKIQLGCDARTSPLFYYSGVTSNCTNWSKILLVYIKWFLFGGKKNEVEKWGSTSELKSFDAFCLGVAEIASKGRNYGMGLFQKWSRRSMTTIYSQESCPGWIQLLLFVHTA